MKSAIVQRRHNHNCPHCRKEETEQDFVPAFRPLVRLTDTIEINGSHCTGEVVESHLYPEIFRHCLGHPAQAIGRRCFGCGKVLTVQDAKAHRV